MLHQSVGNNHGQNIAYIDLHIKIVSWRNKVSFFLYYSTAHASLTQPTRRKSLPHTPSSKDSLLKKPSGVSISFTLSIKSNVIRHVTFSMQTNQLANNALERMILNSRSPFCSQKQASQFVNCRERQIPPRKFLSQFPVKL